MTRYIEGWCSEQCRAVVTTGASNAPTMMARGPGVHKVVTAVSVVTDKLKHIWTKIMFNRVKMPVKNKNSV